MRIERLQIRGFGRLKEQDITINPGTTVFIGPNEAGKSTIQQFVRAMLFGIPSRTYPTERYEPLAGGVHGGILTAIDAEGKRWTISRFATTGDGGSGSANRTEKLSIVRSDEYGQVQEVTQQELERELLGGLSREMFNQLFAISLSELQEIRSLQSDEMSSYLFHAGIGGGSEIIQAERKLTQDMEKLYKPKGRVQDISKVLQTMEQLEKEISVSRSFLKRYNDNATTQMETVELLARQEQARHISIERHLLLRKAQEIRPMWLNWMEATLQESTLPEVPIYPEGGVRRWESLQVEADTAYLRQTQLLRSQSELQAQLDQLPYDMKLEEQGALIERLSTRRDSYDARKRDLLEVRAEASALDMRVTRIVRQIDSRWTKTELQNFSTSVGERESVRRYSVGFSSYDRRIESLAAETQQLRQQMDTTEVGYRRSQQAYKEELDAGNSRFAMLVPRSPQEKTALWNELQESLDRWRENRMVRLASMGQAESDRDIRQRLKIMTRGFLWGSSILTLIVPLLVWSMGFVMPAIITASILLLVDAVLLWNGILKSPPQRGKRADSRLVEDERQDIEVITKLMYSLITNPFKSIGSEGYERHPINAAEIETGVRELRKLMDQWLSWQQKIDKLMIELKAYQDRMSTLRHELSRVEEGISKEEGTFEELEKQWEGWLRQRDLNLQLSPEAVLDMYVLAEQGLENIDQLNKINRKVDQLDKDCLDYETEWLGLLPEGVDPVELSPGAWIELKKKEWDEYQERVRKREMLISRLETSEEELKLLSDELQRVSSLKEDLITQGEADSGEDFLRRGGIYKHRLELKGSILQWEISMFSGSDDQRREAILNVLNTHDETGLELACQHHEMELNEVEASWNELQQKHGRLLQERDQLELLCLHDTAIQKLEEQKASLKELTTDYAVMSICSELISRTRRIYEEEKQPEVLKMASTYFARLTKGSYSRIVMKMGGKELLAEHRDQGLIDSAKLSRGTAEQMYLAMRLALAGTMKSKVSIPLVFDDILVNFDQERMVAALSLLHEISPTRQIIMMTCHPYIVQHIQDIMPTAHFISLQPSI
ncbi:AAA family ATPase [Paenibacillus sp. FA6]|uniref:AAA family ATPase n=1 Tax=Paenibacillus sp. FA6 TaxID=3413029 RepID=UPI003F65B110